MDLNVFNLLDALEDEVESSKKVLGKVLISEDVLLDYLDRIRTLLPEEIQQAKWLSKERERLINEANQEAERIIVEAREEAKRITDESELTKQAQEAAEEIISQAKRVAREIKGGANEFADDILSQMEDNLNKSIIIITNARKELKQMK
jgi:cell division septum initiation protein DivIVA